MSSGSLAEAAHAAVGGAASTSTQARPIEGDRQRRHMFLQDDVAADEDGDDVFSNPDTAELETRSDATGATSPAPNSPGPGSPMNRVGAHHIAVVASSHTDSGMGSSQADPYATIKHGNDVQGISSSQSGKALALGPLPQMNVAALQQQFDQRAYLDATPRPAPGTSSAQTTLVTPTRASPRPLFGRAISASGATMQTMSSSMLPTHSTGGAGRTGPSTPRLVGHASSQSASNFVLPHAQLPSAHGLPTNPHEASTLSKLFAHPPAQSPAEELQAFNFAADPFNRRGNVLASSPVHEKQHSSSLASTRLSRPTTRPPSPDRYVQPSRKSTAHRASMGAAMGLGLPARMTEDAVVVGPTERESSIFERDIEHRDASHILSKQEAIDVAIPSVLDDAIEAITLDSAEQVEIITPHAASPPLALSMQALSAHSNSQIKIQQPALASSTHDSGASSPQVIPGSPLSSAGGAAISEPPPGSMAAQIAERFASTSTKTTFDGEAAAPGTPARHRRPNSDVSNMSSSSSSLRSRSPQAPLTAGVQQVLAATTIPSRAATVAQSRATRHDAPTISTAASTAAASATASPTSATMRSVLPTATALPALPLPNPYRSYSPTASHSPLPDTGSSILPSVSMDGAVMPPNESATMDASLGSLADVIASHPPTSVNSLSNSPLMRMRGLGLDDHSYDPSPYSARSPLLTATSAPESAAHPSQPVSPLAGRNATGTAPAAEEYVAPTTSGKKRLSFFSYADIINQTPAEVLNFDEAVRQAEIASPAKSNLSAINLPSSPTSSQGGGVKASDKRH